MTNDRDLEAELRRTTKRLSVATAAAGIGIWDWDVVDDHLVWDDRMYQLYGVSREDFSGAYQAWESGVHPDDRERAATAVSNALREGTKFFAQFRVVHPDGSIHHIEAYGEVMHDDQGNPVRMVGTNRDITEVKLSEAEVLDRNRLLESQNLELERASRHTSEFLSTMSHELRTPLNAIIGFSRILLDNKDGDLSARSLEFLSRVSSNGGRLLKLLNEILDLSRIEAEEMQLYLEQVAIEPMVRHVLRKLAAEERSTEAVLVKNVPSGLSSIHADSGRLRQILGHLLDNALKFTRRGIVEVRVLAPDGKPLRIDVIDNGAGIPEDRLETVMDPFRQADGSASRRYGGVGIGLTISRALCRAMGFDLVLASVEGEGTLAAIVLDEDAPPVVYQAPSTTGEVVSSGNETVDERVPTPWPKRAEGRHVVLLIDDDPDSLAILQRHLEGFECDVITADTGERGIEIARAIQPSLVLLDLRMPSMPGFVALRIFRYDPQLRHIPVVVCSVIAGEARFQLTDTVEFIDKPVERHVLFEVLRRVMDAEARHQRVLVADDDEDARALVAMVIREFGWQVDTAVNGRDALEKIRADRPDLVILDLVMPELDGFGLLTTLREDETFRDLPVVVCTAADLGPEELDKLRAATPHVLRKGERTRLDIKLVLERLMASS